MTMTTPDTEKQHPFDTDNSTESLALSSSRTSAMATQVNTPKNTVELDASDMKARSLKDKMELDVAFELMQNETDDAVPSEIGHKLRKKIDLALLPLLFLIHALQFMEKTSISFCAILGLLEDNHLSTAHFNNLGSAYYLGFIVFQWPHSWAFQRLPVAKYLGCNLLLWSLLTGLHLLSPGYGGLFALRFLLGASEGCVTPGAMILIAMFYNRTEIGERIGWTIQCNGFAVVVSSLTSFGVYKLTPGAFWSPWKLFMTILCGLCFVTGVLFLLFFPDNPMKAKFLSEEEKKLAVRRIRENQAGIETKKWKKQQFIEALKDPKTWMFCFFAAVSNLQSGVGLQLSLIIKGFNFSTEQTTLLNIPGGFAQVFSAMIAGWFLRKHPNSRSWIAIGMGIVPIISLFCLVLFPLSWRIPLFVAFTFLSSGLGMFTTVVGWVIVTTSGHTKKLTVNAIFQMGYSVGQIVAPQFWEQKYRPKNTVPFVIVLASYFVDVLVILGIRVYLKKENYERERIGEDREDFSYISRQHDDGTVEKVKVNKTLLDLTDRENKAFHYAL